MLASRMRKVPLQPHPGGLGSCSTLDSITVSAMATNLDESCLPFPACQPVVGVRATAVKFRHLQVGVPYSPAPNYRKGV